MFGLILLYVLIAVSGIGVASALRLRSALDIVLMSITFAAAQLVGSIQVISLFYGLTPLGLMLANICVTSIVVGLTRNRLVEVIAVIKADLKERWAEIAGSEGRGLIFIVLGVAVCALLFSTVIAWMIHPAADAYHYTMLCFWKQNATILPFEAYDSRIIGLAFLSESLCFPGVMYAQTTGLFPLVTGVAVALEMLLAYSIARHIGASIGAAACATALLMGYGTVALSILGGRGDMLWSATWFAASIHFLLRTRSPLYVDRAARLIACSLFCFVMACGAKNTVTTLSPIYVLSVFVLVGRTLLSKAVVLNVLVAGVLGLAVSGAIWVYASNWKWFGDPRGPEYLKETLATDFHPQAVWTRLMRGTVMQFLDVIWVPESRRPEYAQLCQRGVRMLGGSDVIPEDGGFYTFRAEEIRPRTSMGWLGSVVFVPGLILAGWCCVFARSFAKERGRRLEIGALLLLAIGAFVMLHVLLRWQSIGISRFVLPGVFVGAPLVALSLEKRLLRIFAILVGFAAMGAYAVFGFGTAARRLADSREAGLAGGVLKLQRSHAMAVEWHWPGKSVEIQEIRESFTLREVVRRLLQELPQPTTIGLIGKNAEGVYLFGSGIQNRVISLLDARDPIRFLVPPMDVDILVLERTEPSAVPAEVLQSFVLHVEVKHEGKPVLVVFKRSK